MSLSLRQSISSSRRWANILAISFGVGFTALSDFAFGQICAELIGVFGSTTVGSPVSVRMAVPAFADIRNRFFAQSVIPGTTFIQWGDGTGSVALVSGLLFDPNCPPFQHQQQACEIYSVFSAAPHMYSAAMTGIHVTVTADVFRLGGNFSLSCSTPSFDVLDTPPAGGDVLGNPTLKLTSARVNVPVTGIVATFSDSNPSAIVSDFTAVIEWGDGATSQGAVSGSGGALSVSAPGDHAYGESGVVTVSVSLSAPGVATSTATGVVKVRGRRG